MLPDHTHFNLLDTFYCALILDQVKKKKNNPVQNKTHLMHKQVYIGMITVELVTTFAFPRRCIILQTSSHSRNYLWLFNYYKYEVLIVLILAMTVTSICPEGRRTYWRMNTSFHCWFLLLPDDLQHMILCIHWCKAKSYFRSSTLTSVISRYSASSSHSCV